uniref:AAA+ ATPase domain-containing protein n=1 Tax=Chlamydomonas leiostraca TaxID=1034604 RepID=A0A7S0RB39_9CHLO|mmetsp:Transcript_18453/g.46688  ORF Transcript_18453/g.46688 Transcript_18453/m.46688 type:complete len:423 (+) Transcript_18453:117-1385(+)
MPDDKPDEKEAPIKALDATDIAFLKNYGLGPYAVSIKKAEADVKDILKRVNDICGVKESDTGLAPPSRWDLVSDKQMMQEEQPLQVARCTKIINPNTDEAKYVINVKQIAKFVVGLGDKVAPTDIEEGMRVGVDRNKYQIQIPLPPKIDPSVTMMTVEEKPDITYSDIGGSKEQIEKMREVVELPMLHPEKFVQLGIDPPKGVLMYGPPGTGKTLLARAVANRTDACFIRVIGSELVQKYIGEGSRMVRELFVMAREHAPSIIFMDEVDSIGSARTDNSGGGGDSEVQRTMLELLNQLDGFDSMGDVKVIMATNRIESLDPALIRPGRIDRKIEFPLPDAKTKRRIFSIHTGRMTLSEDVNLEEFVMAKDELSGADIKAVCTEAGLLALRERRMRVTQADFRKAKEKVLYKKKEGVPEGLYM